MIKSKKGFTILELALAMAFLSFLLLAIGTVTIQLIKVYQKGIAIKDATSASRELIDEFTHSISSSYYRPPAETDKTGFKYDVYFEKTLGIEFDGDTKEVPVNGAFCTGKYSYIWNTGYALNSDRQVSGGDKGEDYYNANVRAIYRYTDENGAEQDYNEDGQPFRLLRVRDNSKSVCVEHDQDTNIYQGGTEPTEFLPPSESGDLAIYDLTIFKPVYHANTGHTLFSGTFILGTIHGGVDIMLSGDFCQDKPVNFTTDFTYCSVNKFNFVARATGDARL